MRQSRNQVAARYLAIQYGWDVDLWRYYADGDCVGSIVILDDGSWIPMSDISCQHGDISIGGPGSWDQLLSQSAQELRKSFTIERALAEALITIQGSGKRSRR
ncbi:hypothetical protein GCM10023170_092210 [Phytohabitans houttuyneae]|uniref:Uncharacterized protein n=1 Tax=Phytohabitans houttuyneae TaxID=1076126 RepID=A0A6V8K0Y6_9ACTN|nr:hypothetical protein Phou_015140 [Phytohabitans houttuyneae]